MSETVSRKRLLVGFWCIIGLWTTYGFFLWWMINEYPFGPIQAIPIAVGGFLLIRGSILLIKVAPKLFGKNRVS